jgi:hypothetical protein
LAWLWFLESSSSQAVGGLRLANTSSSAFGCGQPLSFKIYFLRMIEFLVFSGKNFVIAHKL